MSLRALAAALLLSAAPLAAAEAPLPVAVTDAGYVTPCAEMDNVLVAFAAPGATRFDIRARPPAYAAEVTETSSDPDFTDCAFPLAPVWRFVREKVILHEDAGLRLQGWRLSHSWRPERVPVEVGGRLFADLHLLQLVVKRPGSEVEVLVLYPIDGYWRPKPLPPAGEADSPFGASFLIGPIEVDGRPLVKIARVRFDPAALAFTLDFARGGAATLRVASATPEEIRLEVALDAPAGEAPVAMLSSMFVADDNADVGHMRLLALDGETWTRHPPVGFPPLTALEAAFDKTVPSRHNTLAPDIFVGPFHAPVAP